jgi:hypothetical protein
MRRELFRSQSTDQSALLLPANHDVPWIPITQYLCHQSAARPDTALGSVVRVSFCGFSGIRGNLFWLRHSYLSCSQPAGVVVSNLFAQAGRVVVVGEEPLLEALRSTNGFIQVMLYAPTQSTNRVDATSELPPIGTWSLWQQVSMTNLFYP